jgi:predicted Rossmann fold nucleotide-binding protein DprA/Smf involved in DNA uptake
VKIAIIGSRTFPERAVVISGGAAGVDTWAEQAAKLRGLSTLTFKPEYGKYPPKVAPLKRNEQIVDACTRVAAFWDGKSSGTIHGCKYAKRQGKLVEVFGVGVTYQESEWCR